MRSKIYIATVIDEANFGQKYAERAFLSRYSAEEWAEGWNELSDKATSFDDPNYGLSATVREMDIYP